MLYLMMELKGKFNHKMIKKAKFGDQHFDESVNFILVEKSVSSAVIYVEGLRGRVYGDIAYFIFLDPLIVQLKRH